LKYTAAADVLVIQGSVNKKNALSKCQKCKPSLPLITKFKMTENKMCMMKNKQKMIQKNRVNAPLPTCMEFPMPPLLILLTTTKPYFGEAPTPKK